MPLDPKAFQIDRSEIDAAQRNVQSAEAKSAQIRNMAMSYLLSQYGDGAKKPEAPKADAPVIPNVDFTPTTERASFDSNIKNAFTQQSTPASDPGFTPIDQLTKDNMYWKSKGKV